MSAKLQVKTLSAQINVLLTDLEGKPVYRQVGWTAEGKPNLEQATRIVSFNRGDEVPANISKQELERLRANGAVGTPEEVAAVGLRALEGTTPEPAATTPVEDAGALNLAAMSDDQLAALWEEKPPTVGELTDAVGDDPALAQRVLDAETTAAKGDPRVTLVEAMEKVKAAAE